MRSDSVHGGRTNTIISRQDSPRTYWGIESPILGVALLLCAAGVYRARGQAAGDDA
jgi:hypothetical protein